MIPILTYGSASSDSGTTYYRAAISLPAMPIYNAEKVCHIIAVEFRQFDCDQKICFNCEIFRAHDARRDNIDWKFECEGLRDRWDYFYYLGTRLSKYASQGLITIYNAELDKATERDIPSERTAQHYSYFRYWLRNGYLTADDLAKFCELEKIKITFSSSASRNSDQSTLAEQSDLIEESTPDTLLAASELPISSPMDSAPQGGDVNQATELNRACRTKQRRYDPLGVEIAEIMTKSPQSSPSQVGRALRDRVGSKNTCVVANALDGVKWVNSIGEEVIASASNISDRVRRWKKESRAS